MSSNKVRSEELWSVIQCWETMHKITSLAHPPENGEIDLWAIRPESLAPIPLQNTESKPHVKQKIPFKMRPQSLGFLFGYGGFNPAMNPQASQKSLGKDLPMVIDGTLVVARHDSSAGGDFMSKELVCQLDLDLSQRLSDRRLFTLGNGKTVESIGRVYASCKFARDSVASFQCCFNVLAKLSTSLIMGISFLEESMTLSRNRHRLQDRPNSVDKMPMVNLLQSTERVLSKKYFVCNIDDRETMTNPDSASDLDLMSLEYASKYKYKIMGPGTKVQLADTSIVLTSGKVLATLGLADGRQLLKFLDVLPGLDSDVLLGEDTLESIKAFTTLSESFVDVVVDHKNLPELQIMVDRGFITRILTGSGDHRGVAPTDLPCSSSERSHNDGVYKTIFGGESLVEEGSTSQSPTQYILNQRAKASTSAVRHTKPSAVLVLGGNPLTSTTDFLIATTTTLARQLHRISDGKPHPLALTKTIELQEQRASLADRGVRESTLIDVAPLGYYDRAIASYATFRSLKDNGIIPPGVRFQVLLPTPLSMVILSTQNDKTLPQTEKHYETQLHHTLRCIQVSIPASGLSIQWDLIAEIAIIERERGQSGQSCRGKSLSHETSVFDSLIRLASSVDPDVEMGLCLYSGNSKHVRFESTTDAASSFEVAIQVANNVARNIEQTHHVEYIHLPIPKDRVDAEYFKAMVDLELGNTKLFLGVVHADDETGTRNRLEAAQAAYPNVAGLGVEFGTEKMSREDFGKVLGLCASLTS